NARMARLEFPRNAFLESGRTPERHPQANHTLLPRHAARGKKCEACRAGTGERVRITEAGKHGERQGTNPHAASVVWTTCRGVAASENDRHCRARWHARKRSRCSID